MPTIAVEPLSEHVGADIVGMDLSESVSDHDFGVVLRAFHEHSVIRIRGRQYRDFDVIALSARFGRNRIHDIREYLDKTHPELLLISNIVVDGRPIGLKDSAVKWHSDMAYTAKPNPISVLCAHEVPAVGGGTRFASMIAAHEHLPDDLKTLLEGKMAAHSIRNYNYEPGQGLTADIQLRYPEVLHPVVLTHPVTRRKALYVSEGTTVRIDGMDPEESRSILSDLFAVSCRSELGWTQEWQPGDILVWDNRSVIHKQLPYDPAERRLLKRTTVSDVHPGV